MPLREPHPPVSAADRWMLRALLVVAIVFVGRAAWLLSPDDHTPGDSHRLATAPPKPAAAPRLTFREYAALATVCPTSINELPADLRPADVVQKPAGRLTGVRVASRGPSFPLGIDDPRLAQAETAEADGWLVPPEDWFVPEDKPEPPAPEPPTRESDQAEPTAIQQAPTPVEPPAAVAEPEVSPPPPAQSPAFDDLRMESDAPTATPWPEDLPPADEPAYPSTGDSSDEESGPSFLPPGVSDPAGSGPPPRPEREATPPVPTPKRVEPTRDWDGPFDSVAPEPESRPAPLPPKPTEPEPPRGSSIEEQVLPAPATIPPAVAPEIVEERELLAPPAPERQTLAPPPAPEKIAPPAKPRAREPLFGAPAPKPLAAPHAGGAKAAAEAKAAAGGKSADESHAELFAKNNYPSALECAKCHQRIYDQWSVSSHAYAFVSPMFHRFEQTITELSNGTVGHFCQRCHSPVGTAMGYPRSTSIGDMPPVAREGVTCIACHRVNQRWGKSNGDRRIVPGDIYDPIYGGIGGEGVAKAIADKKGYKVKTSPEEKGPGQPIHTEGRFFDQLSRSVACTSCHQVAVHPGVKLEVVWEQYLNSPACKKGVTCQECHMGRVPGMAGGFEIGSVAELNGKEVASNRRRHNHVFYGPGYSIAHPGVFPQNEDAYDWDFDEWHLFDWRAGWGTDEFEERLEEYEDRGVDTEAWFPEPWKNVDDRADAREIIDDNLERLETKRRYREIVFENGSKIDGPFFREPPLAGRDLKFEYVVTNQNEGHNLPTASLGAQPQLWANVVLIGPDGRRLWESGYTDSNGDLCDIHSVDVRNGRLPFDKQLFNLQTMFLITGATGTDREFYLPVNLDIDQVAHLRPGTFPITTQNHPPFIRMEMRSIAPLGKKRVKYTVPKELVCRPGKYRLSFRMRSRTEPMYFMRLCKSTPEMLRAMVEGTLDIHPQSVEFYVK